MSLFNFKHWHVSNSTDNPKLAQHFPSIEAVFDLNEKIISSSIHSEIFVHQIDNKKYFVKRYFKSIGFASWFGLSRLQLEIKNQRWFNQINLPSARVVAYGLDYFFLKPKRGVLITEGIDNVMDLAMLSKSHPEKFKNPHWCNHLVSQLAFVLRTLHKNRFCHNDMHWRNILVQAGNSENDMHIYLIDCPSGRKLFWPFFGYKRLKDLANIDKLAPNYLSKTQRLRFFYEYRQISKLSHTDKAMIHDILRHKSHRLQRKAKERLRGQLK